MVEQAEQEGDEILAIWAHNTKVLKQRRDVFDYHEWCEGGLVRNPRRLG